MWTKAGMPGIILFYFQSVCTYKYLSFKPVIFAMMSLQNKYTMQIKQKIL